MADYATLQVRRATKEKLASMRAAGETYDELVQRLLKAAIQFEERRFLAELDALYQDDEAFTPLE